MSTNISKLTESLDNLSTQINILVKRIKRYKTLSYLGFALTGIFFICFVIFFIFAMLGKTNPFAILGIVFFVSFIILFQVTLALYMVNKKILIVKLNAYRSILNVMRQEIDKKN